MFYHFNVAFSYEVQTFNLISLFYDVVSWKIMSDFKSQSQSTKTSLWSSFEHATFFE